MKTRHSLPARGASRGNFSLNVETPRKRRKTLRHETTFHISARNFLNLILPADALAFHCPNGGERNEKEAAILKAMGVVAGIPDFIILWDRRAFCLELKAKDGELSIDQRATRARIEDAGVPVEVVRSFEEIRDRLREFGIPLRRAVRFGADYREAA